MVSKAEHAARQQARYDRCNSSRLSTFAKTDVVPEWVNNDPDLTAAWELHRSGAIVKTATTRHCRLDGELAKIGEEWPLSNCSANSSRDKAADTAPKATSSVAVAALRMT
ncbi:Importin subunit beta-1 [Hordeum vulgare]|nr:Importin subunit beta-1 [Hordeum vulgare]